MYKDVTEAIDKAVKASYEAGVQAGLTKARIAVHETIARHERENSHYRSISSYLKGLRNAKAAIADVLGEIRAKENGPKPDVRSRLLSLPIGANVKIVTGIRVLCGYIANSETIQCRDEVGLFTVSFNKVGYFVVLD